MSNPHLPTELLDYVVHFLHGAEYAPELQPRLQIMGPILESASSPVSGSSPRRCRNH